MMKNNKNTLFFKLLKIIPAITVVSIIFSLLLPAGSLGQILICLLLYTVLYNYLLLGSEVFNFCVEYKALIYFSSCILPIILFSAAIPSSIFTAFKLVIAVLGISLLTIAIFKNNKKK